MKSLKPWEAYCLVWWLRLEMSIERLNVWLKWHESKLIWGGIILPILYVYFLFDVECAYFSKSCPISNGSLANTVFTLVGMK